MSAEVTVAKLLKMLVPLVALAAIPVFWWWSIDTLDGKQALFVALGASLCALGFAYRILGHFDLIPDWIPILGGIDDWFALLLMIVGATILALGYHLG